MESAASVTPAGALDTPLQAIIEVSTDLIIVPFVPGQYTEDPLGESDTPVRNTTSVLFQAVHTETGEPLKPIGFVDNGAIFFDFTLSLLKQDPSTTEIRRRDFQVDQDLLQRGQHYHLGVPLTEDGTAEGYELITTFFPLPSRTAITIPPETLLAEDAQGQVVTNAEIIEFELPDHDPARPFDTPVPVDLVQMAIKGPNVALDTSIMIPAPFPTTSPPFGAEPIPQPVGNPEEIDEALRTEIAPMILANASNPLYIRHMAHFLARYWGEEFNNIAEHPLRDFYNPQPLAGEPVVDVQQLFDLGVDMTGEHLAIPVIQQELYLLFDDRNTTTRPSLETIVDPQYYQVFPPFQEAVVDENLRSFMKLAVLGMFGKPSMFHLDNMFFGLNDSGKAPKIIPLGTGASSWFVPVVGGLEWQIRIGISFLREDPNNVQSTEFLSPYQDIGTIIGHESGHTDFRQATPISTSSSGILSRQELSQAATEFDQREQFYNRILKIYCKGLGISERDLQAQAKEKERKQAYNPDWLHNKEEWKAWAKGIINKNSSSSMEDKQQALMTLSLIQSREYDDKEDILRSIILDDAFEKMADSMRLKMRSNGITGQEAESIISSTKQLTYSCRNGAYLLINEIFKNLNSQHKELDIGPEAAALIGVGDFIQQDLPMTKRNFLQGAGTGLLTLLAGYGSTGNDDMTSLEMPPGNPPVMPPPVMPPVTEPPTVLIIPALVPPVKVGGEPVQPFPSSEPQNGGNSLPEEVFQQFLQGLSHAQELAHNPILAHVNLGQSRLNNWITYTTFNSGKFNIYPGIFEAVPQLNHSPERESTNVADGDGYIGDALDFTENFFTLVRNGIINSNTIFEDPSTKSSQGHNQFMAAITSNDPLAPYVDPAQLSVFNHSQPNMKIIDQFAWQKFFRPGDIATIMGALAMGLPRPADATNFPFKPVP